MGHDEFYRHISDHIYPFHALLADPGSQRTGYFYSHIKTMDECLVIHGWLSLTVKGKENFKKGETYIVTCNHNSMLDVPLSSPFIQGPNKTIAKSSFARVPLFGSFYMKGSVLVDRKNEISRRQSFDKMKAVLRQGIHMCIYPEGTRNRTNEPLTKFHGGAFKLPVETGTAIMPAVIFNTKKVLPANKPFFFWPSKVAIHFLPPVSTANLTADQLKEKIFQITMEYYTSHQDQ